MAEFVVSHALLLLLTDQPPFLFKTQSHPIHGVLKVTLPDLSSATPRRVECSFVNDIRKIRAHHSGRTRGNSFEIHIRANGQFARA